MKITGFDKLQQQLKDAQKALSAIDGELGKVHFNPEDPASIDGAIREMETLLDDRVGQYASNPIVAPLIEGAKESYRQAILDKAAEARLEGNSGE